MLGNKIDKDEREVSKETGERWARELNMLFAETSAKDLIEVNEVFEKAVNLVINYQTKITNVKDQRSKSSVKLIKLEDKKKGCCQSH